MVNNRGWIKIIESSIAFVIIAGVLLSLNVSNLKSNSYTDYDFVEQIMSEMQINESIRDKLVNDEAGVINVIDDFFSKRLANSQIKYSFVVCNYMTECEEPQEIKSIKREVYSTKRTISADLSTFNPKIVQLFVWR